MASTPSSTTDRRFLTLASFRASMVSRTSGSLSSTKQNLDRPALDQSVHNTVSSTVKA